MRRTSEKKLVPMMSYRSTCPTIQANVRKTGVNTILKLRVPQTGAASPAEELCTTEMSRSPCRGFQSVLGKI